MAINAAPRVTVAIGGAFPSPYQYADALHRAGSLEHLVSFMPRRWSRRRFAHELPDEQLTTIDWIGALYKACAKFVPASDLSLITSYLFDWSASHSLRKCNVLNVWSGSGLISMRTAKAKGIPTVLCTGSAHIRYQKEIIETEYLKFGLDVTATHPRMVARAEAEYAEAQAIVVPSRFVHRTLVENGVDESKIIVVPHPLTRRLASQRKVADRFTVLSVGSHGIRKGTHHLLSAMKQLAIPGARLILAGGISRDFEPILKDYPGVAHLPGRVSDTELTRLYSEASVFVLPSLEDGWGHVTLEAMSCGTMPIVSRNAGSSDAIRDGINGFTFPAGDVQALMNAIAAAHEEPIATIEMGKRAARTVEDYTVEAYSDAMVSAFESVLRVADRAEGAP